MILTNNEAEIDRFETNCPVPPASSHDDGRISASRLAARSGTDVDQSCFPDSAAITQAILLMRAKPGQVRQQECLASRLIYAGRSLHICKARRSELVMQDGGTNCMPKGSRRSLPR
jgi:hypothetical protein